MLQRQWQDDDDDDDFPPVRLQPELVKYTTKNRTVGSGYPTVDLVTTQPSVSAGKVDFLLLYDMCSAVVCPGRVRSKPILGSNFIIVVLVRKGQPCLVGILPVSSC